MSWSETIMFLVVDFPYWSETAVNRRHSASTLQRLYKKRLLSEWICVPGESLILSHCFDQVAVLPDTNMIGFSSWKHVREDWRTLVCSLKFTFLSWERRSLCRTPHYFTRKVCLFQVLLEQSFLQLMHVSILLGRNISFSHSPPTLIWSAIS